MPRRLSTVGGEAPAWACRACSAASSWRWCAVGLSPAPLPGAVGMALVDPGGGPGSIAASGGESSPALGG